MSEFDQAQKTAILERLMAINTPPANHSEAVRLIRWAIREWGDTAETQSAVSMWGNLREFGQSFNLWQEAREPIPAAINPDEAARRERVRKARRAIAAMDDRERWNDVPALAVALGALRSGGKPLSLKRTYELLTGKTTNPAFAEVMARMEGGEPSHYLKTDARFKSDDSKLIRKAEKLAKSYGITADELAQRLINAW